MSDVTGVIITLIVLCLAPFWAPVVFVLMGGLLILYILIYAIGSFFEVIVYQLKLFFYHMDNFEWIMVGGVAIIVIPLVAYLFYKSGVIDAVNDMFGG